jgi:hypothetical protein
MRETPAPVEAKPRRSMLAFYISIAVALALLVTGYFAWTPLRIRYSAQRLAERRVFSSRTKPFCAFTTRDRIWKDVLTIRADPDRMRHWPKADHFSYLVEVGPRAGAVWRRFLRRPDLAGTASRALVVKKSTWAMPMLIELAQDEDDTTAWWALITADLMLGKDRILGPTAKSEQQESLSVCRRRLLEWWKEEGTAKYGRSDR